MEYVAIVGIISVVAIVAIVRGVGLTASVRRDAVDLRVDPSSTAKSKSE